MPPPTPRQPGAEPWGHRTSGFLVHCGGAAGGCRVPAGGQTPPGPPRLCTGAALIKVAKNWGVQKAFFPPTPPSSQWCWGSGPPSQVRIPASPQRWGVHESLSPPLVPQFPPHLPPKESKEPCPTASHLLQDMLLCTPPPSPTPGTRGLNKYFGINHPHLYKPLTTKKKNIPPPNPSPPPPCSPPWPHRGGTGG